MYHEHPKEVRVRDSLEFHPDFRDKPQVELKKTRDKRESGEYYKGKRKGQLKIRKQTTGNRFGVFVCRPISTTRVNSITAWAE
jgi:hypothetical protein